MSVAGTKEGSVCRGVYRRRRKWVGRQAVVICVARRCHNTRGLCCVGSTNTNSCAKNMHITPSLALVCSQEQNCRRRCVFSDVITVDTIQLDPSQRRKGSVLTQFSLETIVHNLCDSVIYTQMHTHRQMHVHTHAHIHTHAHTHAYTNAHAH